MASMARKVQLGLAIRRGATPAQRAAARKELDHIEQNERRQAARARRRSDG